MKKVKQCLQDMPLARKMTMLFLGTAVLPILILSSLAAGLLFNNNTESSIEDLSEPVKNELVLRLWMLI